MTDILKKIIEQKRVELKRLTKEYSFARFHEEIEQQKCCRGFTTVIQEKVANKKTAIIAEIKKASPSQGVIRANFDPEKIAIDYEKSGATCLSVLTDEYFFQGHVEHLGIVKKASTLPIIRKDFMIDIAQIYHSRSIGADCVLLIVAALSDNQMNELYDCANTLGLNVLVEAHTLEEIERANLLKPKLLGINNRNLRTFQVDINTTLIGKSFAHKEAVVVCESGIKNKQDVQNMIENEVFSFLIGESFMRQPFPGRELKKLFN